MVVFDEEDDDAEEEVEERDSELAAPRNDVEALTTAEAKPRKFITADNNTSTEDADKMYLCLSSLPLAVVGCTTVCFCNVSMAAMTFGNASAMR